ncbi:MAG: MerR family transcriptional regulator [Paracoccaceae bacterium]
MVPVMSLSIGQVADKSGCTPPTIRYYESIGLLPPTPRSDAGRRCYGPQEVARLAFIRRARDFGLGIPQVRDLLAAAEAPATACATARPVVEEHIRALRAKRAELKALDAALAAILVRCDEGCRNGNPGACAIFDDFHLPGAVST